MTREWEHGNWTTGMRALDQDHRGYTGTRNGEYQGLEYYSDNMVTLDIEALRHWEKGTLRIGVLGHWE